MKVVANLALNQPLFAMLRKSLWVATALILSLGVPAYAQSTQHPLAQAFSTAMGRADVNGLTALLDDEVELMQPGASGTYRKQVVSSKLEDFLRQNPPARFLLKHQGSSADGQVYAIGQLTTQSGSSYKVLLRAKPAGANYRIFKIDLIQ